MHVKSLRAVVSTPEYHSSQSSSRFSLPGLTLPLNWVPEWSDHPHVRLFRNALGADQDGEASLNLTTLREFTMLQIMDTITDKPNWYEKVFDETISDKWKQEMLQGEGHDVSQAMADWITEELCYKAQVFSETGAISIYNGDVVKSDIAVPSELRESLRNKVGVLENIPEVYKDYCPGSDDKVLNLVHPSLFPLMYGCSRVLKDTLISLDDCIKNIGKGEIVPIPPEKDTMFVRGKTSMNSNGDRPPFSNNFQWLPCEVEFSEDGSSKIVSYINNLHPRKHQDLYSIIEKLIDKAIPLWNMTLKPLKNRHLKFDRIPFASPKYDPDPDKIPDEDAPPREDGEIEAEYLEAIWDWKESQRRVIQPDAAKFRPPSLPKHMKPMYFKPGTREIKEEIKVDLKRDYGERGLQIIVKLANIELAPEKPEYEGGSWHVEGQLTLTILETKTDGSKKFFGCQNWSSGVQEVGSVHCCEGRLITFPNILQHQVQPFKLADPTKAGHRKIVAFFLVDPNIRIISTANVPPQQRSWWGEEIAHIAALNKLSAELKENIVNNVDDFPIGMDEAKEIRLELMEERKSYAIQQESMFKEPKFAL
ncbi:hypothetical protein B7463_g7047, partial [Scytalidium lignicola]